MVLFGVLKRRDLFTDPEDDPEAELIRQRAEAMRQYLELLAEKVQRVEGANDDTEAGGAMNGPDQLTEFRGRLLADWIYEVRV